MSSVVCGVEFSALLSEGGRGVTGVSGDIGVSRR